MHAVKTLISNLIHAHKTLEGEMALSEPAEFGLPDFILLSDITEEALLQNLQLRFEKGKVESTGVFHSVYYIMLFTVCRITQVNLL